MIGLAPLSPSPQQADRPLARLQAEMEALAALMPGLWPRPAPQAGGARAAMAQETPPQPAPRP